MCLSDCCCLPYDFFLFTKAILNRISESNDCKELLCIQQRSGVDVELTKTTANNDRVCLVKLEVASLWLQDQREVEMPAFMTACLWSQVGLKAVLQTF